MKKRVLQCYWWCWRRLVDLQKKLGRANSILVIVMAVTTIISIVGIVDCIAKGDLSSAVAIVAILEIMVIACIVAMMQHSWKK